MVDFQIPQLGDNEELQEIRQCISPFELERNLKFSKNGLVKFIEELLAENDPFSEDKSIARMWDNKLNNPN